MDTKTQKATINRGSKKINIFSAGEDCSFMPWGAGEKGERAFIKLEKDGEMALFDCGDEVIAAEVGKHIFRLLNEGWKKEGEVKVEFDGRSDAQKEMEDLFQRDLVHIELGRKLLPLVDPGSGAPLMDVLGQIRKDLAKVTGFILPGIRVKDNMHIPFDNYVIYVKESPVATGEIFLDRFMVMGDKEKLAQLKGWNTKDPAFNAPAVWIEKEQLPLAEEKELMVMGPLNVMVTHIMGVIESQLKNILGLQEVQHLLQKLGETHPILVEDYLNDKKKLRQIKKIFTNLLSERVGIRDLVTIMEVIGEHDENLEKTEMVTEMVRISQARRILWTYLDMEGKISALVLSDKLEEKIRNGLQETKNGLRFAISPGEVESILKGLKKTLEEFNNPQVIFCKPDVRLYFRKLTEINFPNLGILSTAEICPGIHIEILGQVKCADESSDGKKNEEEEKKSGGLFGLMK